jgi:hypothetical protein
MTIEIIEQRLRNVEKLPEEFQFYRWESLPHDASERTHMQFSGGVTRETFKSGPRKGQPNWSKEDKSLARVFIVSEHEAKQWQLDYSEETGNCAECMGEKKTVAGWGKETGTRYRECYTCKGTGLAAARAAGIGGGS